MAGTSKDFVKTAIYRVIRNIQSEILKKKKYHVIAIPYVGELVIKRLLVGVKFDILLTQETKVRITKLK